MNYLNLNHTITMKPDYVRRDGKIYKEVDLEQLDKKELLDILKKNLRDLKPPIVINNNPVVGLYPPKPILTPWTFHYHISQNEQYAKYRDSFDISTLSSNLLSFVNSPWTKN